MLLWQRAVVCNSTQGNCGIAMPSDHSPPDFTDSALDLAPRPIERACMRSYGWNLMMRRLDDCLPSRMSWKPGRMPQSSALLSSQPLCSPELLHSASRPALQVRTVSLADYPRC